MIINFKIKDLIKKKPIRRSKKTKRYNFLQTSPQKTAICKKFIIMAPKKPNSANRKVVKIQLVCNSRLLYAYIPGQSPSGLNPFNTVLIKGGRVRDLPGIRYKLIPGALDFKGIWNRKTSRSKYGVKLLLSQKKRKPAIYVKTRQTKRYKRKQKKKKKNNKI